MDELERLRVRLLAEKHYRRTRPGGCKWGCVMRIGCAALSAFWHQVMQHIH